MPFRRKPGFGTASGDELARMRRSALLTLTQRSGEWTGGEGGEAREFGGDVVAFLARVAVKRWEGKQPAGIPDRPAGFTLGCCRYRGVQDTLSYFFRTKGSQ